jgi:hypothetical protein
MSVIDKKTNIADGKDQSPVTGNQSPATGNQTHP